MPDIVQFRPFEPPDLALYLRWINQKEIWEVDNAGPYELRTAESFAAQWEKIVGWRRSWFFAVNDVDIGYIGFISDQRDQLTNEFFIVIGEVDYWGGGHGRMAMAWLFEKARSLGLSSLRGQVLGNNERALKFYARLGFEVVGEGEPTFQRGGERFTTIRIEKPLR